MENAVQALLIAAGVLIGIVILSLGVSLYTSLSGYVESTEQDIISKEIQQFNEQFVKYVDSNNLTIQDVVTAANIAFENNRDYQLDVQTENNYYVTVKLNGVALEDDINLDSAKILAEGLEQKYECNVLINQITKRVDEVNFETIP